MPQVMPGDTLERYVSDLVQTLPPAEQMLTALLNAAARHAPADEAVALIRQDAALCANLLHLANASCLHAAGTPSVETIEDALGLLGVEPLVMLVGATYCLRRLRPAAVSAKTWTDYERHGCEIAEACTLLARRLRLSSHACQMYTVAGLTHDIGRAVIMIALDAASASLVGTLPEAMARIVQDERQAYGMNHCEIGARIFHNWHFSPLLLEGILRHHTPLLDHDFSFPLIFVSHFVTMSDFTGEIIAHMLPAELLGKLGLTAEDLDAAAHTLRRAARR